MSLQLHTCPTPSLLLTSRASLSVHSKSGLSTCSHQRAPSLRVAHERTALGTSCASSVSAPLASLHGQRPIAQGMAPLLLSTHLSLSPSCPPLTLPSDAQIPLDDVKVFAMARAKQLPAPFARLPVSSAARLLAHPYTRNPPLTAGEFAQLGVAILSSFALRAVTSAVKSSFCFLSAVIDCCCC